MSDRASMPEKQVAPVLFAHHMVLIGLAQGKFTIILVTTCTLEFLLELKVCVLFSIEM